MFLVWTIVLGVLGLPVLLAWSLWETGLSDLSTLPAPLLAFLVVYAVVMLGAAMREDRS